MSKDDVARDRFHEAIMRATPSQVSTFVGGGYITTVKQWMYASGNDTITILQRVNTRPIDDQTQDNPQAHD